MVAHNCHGKSIYHPREKQITHGKSISLTAKANSLMAKANSLMAKANSLTAKANSVTAKANSLLSAFLDSVTSARVITRLRPKAGAES